MNNAPTDKLNLDEIERVKQIVLANPKKIDMSHPRTTQISKRGKIIGRSCCVAGIVRTLHPELDDDCTNGPTAIAQAFGCDLVSADTIFVATFTDKLLSEITAEEIAAVLDELAKTGRVRRYDEKAEEVQA